MQQNIKVSCIRTTTLHQEVALILSITLKLYIKKLPFELYKNPAETKEVIQTICLLKVVMQRAV